MSETFSLAYLTELDLPPAQAIAVAACTGYQFVGLRLLPAAPGGMAYPLMDDPRGRAETLAAIRNTGVGVFDLELIRLDPTFRASDYLSFFEVGAELGAKAILVAGNDADEARLTASFAALCEACAPLASRLISNSCHGRQSPTRAAPCAWSRRLRSQTAATLVEALHFARSRVAPCGCRGHSARPAQRHSICDVPAAIRTRLRTDPYGAMRAALARRGRHRLSGLFATLPDDLPISVEIPNDQARPGSAPEEWARQALAASRAVLANRPTETSSA